MDSSSRVARSTYVPIKTEIEGTVYFGCGVVFLVLSALADLCNCMDRRPHGIPYVSANMASFYRDIGKGLVIEGAKQTTPMLIVAGLVFQVFKVFSKN